MLILPSDHLISKENIFKSVLRGLKLLEKGELVTFSIKPTSPQTAYGYLHLSDSRSYKDQNFLDLLKSPQKKKP